MAPGISSGTYFVVKPVSEQTCVDSTFGSNDILASVTPPTVPLHHPLFLYSPCLSFTINLLGRGQYIDKTKDPSLILGRSVRVDRRNLGNYNQT